MVSKKFSFQKLKYFFTNVWLKNFSLVIKREVLNFRGKLFQSLLAITEKRVVGLSFPHIEWCSKTQMPTSQTAQTDHS